MSEPSETTGAPAGGETVAARVSRAESIVATAGRSYRRARYVVCAMIFIFGLWFCVDGFDRWPQQKRAFDNASESQRITMVKPHSDTDILLNKLLGASLPVVSVLMLIFFLYRSRGEYRYENRTLHVPGHPPISLDRITELDRALWDRKGILIVHYTLADGGQPAKLKLDDFVYEQKPTDAIVATLTEQLFPDAAKS